MSDEQYPAKHALLVAELEAAKLENEPPDAIAGVVKELLELGLGQGDAGAARRALAELRAVLSLDDPGNVMLLDYYAARVALADDDGASALTAAERAVALARQHELDDDLPHVLGELADSLEAVGRKTDAKQAREEAATLFESTGQLTRAGLTVHQLATKAPPEEARALFRRALTLTEQGGEPRGTAFVLYSLGLWHEARGEYLPARHALERSLETAREDSDALGESLCLEHLAWLEVEAFRHRAAIALATEALDGALDDFQRGRALDARANARHRLHDHLGARADLLEAARAFEAAGEPEWVTDCRRRARGDRLLHYLHYLPSWVFRHKDMSTPASALKREFQPFGLWLGGVALLWLVGWTLGAKQASSRLAKKTMLFIATLPASVLLGTLAAVLIVLLVQRICAKRDA